MAAAARTRVLKKRAAHNHRSSRTRDPSDMASPLPAGYGPRAAPGMRILGTAAPPKPFFVQSTMLARCATRPPAVPARRVAASQALRAVTLGAAAASVLLACGGRSGSIGAARAALLAADWTHNASLQSVVLAVEQAYFLYLGTKALLDAQQTTLKEAQTNLEAAEQRHRVGLATIADVLQARTALSQARLALQATQGDLQTTRGGLALSMGLPANIPYDLAVVPDTTLPLGVVEGVDTLITQALRARPDLAAQRALVDQARARGRGARSQALPTLSVGGNPGETYFLSNPPSGSAKSGNSYNATLTISIPLFSGWSQIYNVKAASAAADAAARRAQGFEQEVVYQVFNAYYGLRTSTQQVRTSRDLLASATESEQVALARYKAGAGSLLDLLAAQAALASARALAIQARLSWNTALAQLAHDVGILGLDGSSPLQLQTDTTGTPK